MITEEQAAAFAVCRSNDPAIWFPEEGDTQAEAAAIALCANCPLKAACLRVGIDGHEEGIWGGTTAAERRRIRRREQPPPSRQLPATCRQGHPMTGDNIVYKGNDRYCGTCRRAGYRRCAERRAERRRQAREAAAGIVVPREPRKPRQPRQPRQQCNNGTHQLTDETTVDFRDGRRCKACLDAARARATAARAAKRREAREQAAKEQAA